jgi:hypothetical protein
VIKPEFLIERDGQQVVLYAGLLDLAHRQGLRAIRTQLLQIPSEENGRTAIVRAEVETERGTFTGLGDASPANVAPAFVDATIRLAETRAKARALRDAVNVGVATLEELADLPQEEVSPGDKAPETLDRALPPERPPATALPSAPPESLPARGSATAATSGVSRATPAQVRTIYALGRGALHLSEGEVDARVRAQYGVPPGELSPEQAAAFITTLKGGTKGTAG